MLHIIVTAIKKYGRSITKPTEGVYEETLTMNPTVWEHYVREQLDRNLKFTRSNIGGVIWTEGKIILTLKQGETTSPQLEVKVWEVINTIARKKDVEIPVNTV